MRMRDNMVFPKTARVVEVQASVPVFEENNEEVKAAEDVAVPDPTQEVAEKAIEENTVPAPSKKKAK